jgi:prophage DNA circulation protein
MRVRRATCLIADQLEAKKTMNMLMEEQKEVIEDAEYVEAQIRELIARPSYTVDGVSKKWTEHLAELRRERESLFNLLKSMPGGLSEEFTEVTFEGIIPT